MKLRKIGFLRAAGQMAALLALVLSSVLAAFTPAQAERVETLSTTALASGPAVVVLPGSGDNFYKIAVNKTGMHAITYEMLAAAGLPVDTIAPSTFQIFEHGQEIARRVIDADSSDSFTAGDSIVFYGRSVWTYYTTTNIYWLTYGSGTGQEMALRSAAPSPALPQVDSFREKLHLEQDKEWVRAIPLTGQADRWHWIRYATSCIINKPAVVKINVETPGVAAGSFTATLTPRLRGFNKNDSTPVQHTAIFTLADTEIGTATFVNQNEFTGSFNFDQALLVEGSNEFVLTAPCITKSTTDLGLINWYDVSYHRTYAAPATGQFAFNVDVAGPVGLTLTGLTGSVTSVYDITDPQQPQLLTDIAPALIASSSLALSHTLDEPGSYIASAPEQLLTPDGITQDTPSSWRSPAEGADWIVITHPDFLSEAERLAAHRRAYQKFRTAVVLVQDVYDEFNGGLKDKEAIRAFVHHAYENWPAPAPRYVVLLGDGHYDPRYLLSSTTLIDYMPPYLAAVNPFDGIVASDNRYVAYDPVPPAKNPAPFMHLGRLPANSLTDAQAMVDKIIVYETTPADGTWNQTVLFIADNADQGGNFPLNSDKVAKDGSVLPDDYDRQTVYYGVNYTDKTDANNALIDAINQGALFVNYHGHASTRDWASEPLFPQSDQARLTNVNMYPVFLPMTCLEGDFINPNLQSFGENIVRLPNAGAVASWSPTGKGIAQGHDVIYEAFYKAIFEHGITEVGPATTYAKQVMYDSASLFKDLIDSYILFGDPAMPLNLLAPDVAIQKQALPDAPWQPGQMVTYTLAYSNSGAITATGVVLTDTLPAPLINPAWTASDPAVAALPGADYRWQLPDLAPGAMGVITITAQLSPLTPRDSTITNTAVIATEIYEPPAGQINNTSSVQSLVPPELFLLGGRTFIDVGNDGNYDPPDDEALIGVSIEVRDSSGAVAATTTSGAEGLWFVMLPAGTYTVTASDIFNNNALVSHPEVTVEVGGNGTGNADVDFLYQAPTGLEIEYFQATWSTNGANLVWATRLELIVEYFDVYRAADPLADPSARTKINPAPIMPKAPPGMGATYKLLDTSAQPGTPTYYWLRVQAADQVFWIGPTIPMWKSIVWLPMIQK